MFARPSTLNLCRSVLCAAYIIGAAIAGPSSALAQQPLKSKGQSKPVESNQRTKRAQTKRDEGLLRKLRQQQQQAINALVEVANAARSFDDVSYRINVQATVAEAICQFDERQARHIFQRAWEAARSADHESEEGLDREAALEDEDSGDIAGPYTEFRDDVLSKAALCDSRLTESLLEELANEERKLNKDKATGDQSSDSAWGERSEKTARRIELAENLLERGEHRRAAQLVTPAIKEGINADLIEFMLRLRSQNAEQADALFLRSLQATGSKAARADVNSVLMLSSYLLSPKTLVVMDEGAAQFRAIADVQNQSATPPPIGPNIREAFFSLAARVFIQQAQTAQANPDQAASLFFGIQRLLPFFEREAPSYLSALHAMRNALADRVEDSRRETLSKQSELFSLTPKNSIDSLQSQLDALAQEQNKNSRRFRHLALVYEAAELRQWARARNLAAEIEDAEEQRYALTLIAVEQIRNLSSSYTANTKDDYERAAAFVGSVDVPAGVRAWGYAQAAQMAERRGQHNRAVGLLGEAAALAESVGTGPLPRLLTLAVVTKTAASVDAQRAWELIGSVTQAVNSIREFSGHETALDLIDTPSIIKERVNDENFAYSIEAPFTFDEAYRAMARLDFERALAEARLINGAVPRALATIAVARVPLESGERKPEIKSKPYENSVK